MIPDPSSPSPRSYPSVASVECDVDLRQVEVNGLPLRVPPSVAGVLRWDPADPWAVTLEFVAADRTWAFGWELLAAASVAAPWHPPVGDGDVQLLRATPDAFYVALSSPDGSAVFTADAFDVAVFVEVVRPRQERAAAALVWPDTPAALDAAIDADRAS